MGPDPIKDSIIELAAVKMRVGANRSEAWANGNYGNKIKKALELQKKGSDIQIINEKDVAVLN